MLITAILLVFACMLTSLFAGLYFLFFDKKNSKNLLISLSFRVCLALLLVVLLVTGFMTGQLGSKAPWSSFQSPHSQILDNINEDKQP